MKKHVLAAFLALAATGALAADQTVNLLGPSATFTGTPALLDGGADAISFDGLAAGTYSYTLTLSGQFITLTSATLTDAAQVVQPLNVTNVLGIVSFGYLLSTGEGPSFVLDLAGTVTDASKANYNGTLSVVPVPEPETYAMFLAGLGAMGFMLRRRSKD